MGVVTALHVVGAVLAVASAVWLTSARGRATASQYLRWTAWGTVVWTLCVVSVTVEGIHDWHQILWLPSVAFTSGAFLIWAGEFSRYDWSPPRALVVMWLAVPSLILGVRLAWGHDARVPLFVANTFYCFAVLVVAAMWISRRAHDPDERVRWVARGAVTTAVAVLIAEAFRANITDLMAALVVAAITTAVARSGDDMRGRPSPDTLIDDLGALLFVFDHEQRLVDLNAPARHFYTLRGAVPPEPGTRGASLLGADLHSLDTVLVHLAVGAGSVPFSGYVQRLPSHGSPSRGWVCLLRRSLEGPSERERRMTRRTVMARLPAHDPVTRLLSERAFDDVLADASSAPQSATTPAVTTVVQVAHPAALGVAARTLADAWEHRPECVALGRCGPLRLALVVRDLTEPAVRAWCDANLQGVDVHVATCAGSLREGRVLVAEAVGRLSSSSGRNPGT